MATSATQPRASALRIRAGEFWSGDLGLTLILISLSLLVFVVTPMREGGVQGRLLLEVAIGGLMIFGALAAKQSMIQTIIVIAFIVTTGVLLGVGRLLPNAPLRVVGSICSTITLLLYVRIVLLVMLRGGRVTWSRIQGGLAAYLLVGMAWASAYQVVEQLQPGSIQFVTEPRDLDQMIAKLTYYSFCTLSTIGGEISAVTPIARSLRIAEAAVGQLLPSILIGALVAMAMQAHSDS